MRKDAVQSKTCILVNFTIAMKNYQELITYRTLNGSMYIYRLKYQLIGLA